jgi:acetyltransferase-like isoleucine patch superfamily enzyme
MKLTGKNISISSRAKIGKNVQFGENVVVYDNVEIGDSAIICNDCVIGEPLASYYDDPEYQNPLTIIGRNSLVRSHAIIYAGCMIGDEFSTGHRVTIRENTIIGKNCSLGTLTDIQNNVRIGDYCRLHSNVHISAQCSLGNYVFMYPFSVMTNDPFPPSETIIGSHIGNYTQIAVHVVILPGIHIGEHCLIGASSVVTKKIPDYSLATGNPAIILRDVRKIRALGKGHPYPWPPRFSRGMPWDKIGYDAWFEAGQEAKVE